MLSSKRQLALSIGVLVVAAGLRLWQLSQTPPGLYHDEAYHLSQAREIAYGEAFPVYLTGNNGNEPAFAYLSVLALWGLGDANWAGRLVSAWAGLVGVALTIRTGAEMFPRRGVGILAGMVLATLYGHITVSRLGTQPILASTAAVATIAALWHAARTGRLGAYILAGGMMAFGLYSYLIFRVFLIVPVAAGLALWVAHSGQRRSLFAGSLVAWIVCLIAWLPLASFFIKNPAWFFHRFTQVAAVTPGALIANAIIVVEGLFYRGDLNWRHNLPGRPALDIGQSLFFLLGLVFASRRWRKPEMWALGAWLVIGHIPAWLTDEVPHFLRAITAAPALALVIALGLEAIWRRLATRTGHRLIIAIFGASVALTVFDYFGRWAKAPDLFPAFNTLYYQRAQALRALSADSQILFTPRRRDYWRPASEEPQEADTEPLLYVTYRDEEETFEYSLGREIYQRFTGFDGQSCLVIPDTTKTPATYAIVTSEDGRTLPALEAVFPEGKRHAALSDSSMLELYEVPSGQPPQLNIPASRQINYADLVKLIAFTTSSESAEPGEQLALSVIWQARQRAPVAYKIFVHLIGLPASGGSIVYAQYDTEPCGNSYPTTLWSPNYLILDHYTLNVPTDLAPGAYSLRAGWYDPSTNTRLPATDDAGQFLGDSVELRLIQVVLP